MIEESSVALLGVSLECILPHFADKVRIEKFIAHIWMISIQEPQIDDSILLKPMVISHIILGWTRNPSTYFGSTSSIEEGFGQRIGVVEGFEADGDTSNHPNMLTPLPSLHKQEQG